MILLAIAVLGSAAAGIVTEPRAGWARPFANRLLLVMLYAIFPLVAYINIAHLQVTAGAAVGVLAGYLGVALAGVVAWRLVAARGASRATVGGMVLCVILCNTGYMGDPMTIAVLGSGQLPHALVFDQLVMAPTMFTAGFAIAQAFGDRGGGSSPRERLALFITRNPPLWGVVAGLIVPTAWAPQVLVNISHVVLDLMLVGGFFAVGVTLSDERRLLGAPDGIAAGSGGGRLLSVPDRPVTIALVCRFAIAPAVLGAVALAGVDVPTAYVLQALMPTGLNALILGNAFGLDVRRITDTIVWSTLAVLIVGVAISVA